MVLIDNVLHKILNIHKGFLTEKTHRKFLCVYTSVPGSITSALSLTILGQKEQRRIIKLVTVVNMLLPSSSLTKVSWQKGPLFHHKYLNVQPLQPFHQMIK